MTDKQERLNELKRILYPSDEEIEEKLKLEEELKLEYEDQIGCKESIPQEPRPDMGIKKRKRSLFELLYQKLKKKPITQEEIERLKKERVVAYLKRDIARANYDRKNLKTGFFGSNKKESRTKKSKPEKIFKSSGDGGIRKMMGENKDRDYSGLIGR